MRLLEIEVENFGMFRGSRLGFGDGRFHLVCGPNEAGKTTLLQLIRELLFGFAVRNPYAFPEHEGEMAATVVAEMKDATRIRFRRRKGRANIVTGEVEGTGRTFDETGLVRLLGNANAELYQNIFGFSLAELASGEESLKNARLEEALYGGGLGGLANFQRSLAAIQEEHQSLFAASAGPSGRRLTSCSQTFTTGPRSSARRWSSPATTRKCASAERSALPPPKRSGADRDDCFRHQAHIERLIQACLRGNDLPRLNKNSLPSTCRTHFRSLPRKSFVNCDSKLEQVKEEVERLRLNWAETEGELRRIHLHRNWLRQKPMSRSSSSSLSRSQVAAGISRSEPRGRDRPEPGLGDIG